MKVFKELPISIATTIRLLSIPAARLRNNKKTVVPVIVSLTSIPSRLPTLHLVIRSLMTQTVQPNKIVLWLHKDLKAQLPKPLKKLQGSYFEIAYSDLHCSHRKLIHSLEKYPDAIIITCDDDLMYRKNWLETLYKEHLKNPESIIGNHCVHINHDKKANPLPFKKWRVNESDKINKKAFVPIGAWGILYPPNSLDPTVQDVSLFMKLAPKADDLWFKAMALRNETLSLPAEVVAKNPIPIAGTQKVALKSENLGLDKNTVQWQALNDHFDLANLIVNDTK